MDFGGAIHCMKGGDKVYRNIWARNDLVIGIKKPDDHSQMTQPFLFVQELWDGGGSMPWTPTHDDMLAEDWQML